MVAPGWGRAGETGDSAGAGRASAGDEMFHG